MVKDIYALGNVQRIYPKLNIRTFQLWSKHGIIRPAVPSAGTGRPVGFSYLNLIEIGLVWQLTASGANSHAYLRKVMDYRDKLKMAGRWIDGNFEFDCFFMGFAGAPIGAAGNEEKIPEGPPFVLVKRDALNDFFRSPTLACSLIIDVLAIKQHVDRHLTSL